MPKPTPSDFSQVVKHHFVSELLFSIYFHWFSVIRGICHRWPYYWHIHRCLSGAQKINSKVLSLWDVRTLALPRWSESAQLIPRKTESLMSTPSINTRADATKFQIKRIYNMKSDIIEREINKQKLSVKLLTAGAGLRGSRWTNSINHIYRSAPLHKTLPGGLSIL